MSNDKIILSIDPGTEKLGISLLSEVEKDLQFLGSWHIAITPDDLEFRYKGIFRAMCDILTSIKCPIDYYAIETPFFGRNIATTIKLGTTRGIIMACIYRRNRDAKIVDINPVEVRNHFGLGRSAKKEECHKFLLKAFRATVEESQLSEDVLDSIGIGLAALSKITQFKLDESKNIRTKNTRGKRRPKRSSKSP